MLGAEEKEGEKEGEKENGKEKLTLMAVGGAKGDTFTEVVEYAAKKYNESNEFGVNIELEWYASAQYKTKLPTLMTQNDMTDIFFTWEAGFMKDYVESGKIYSLSEALDNDPEWKGRFNGGAFDALTFDNEIYAVPMGQAIVPVYYNVKMFEENDVEVPTTWEEFMNAIETFKKAGIVPMSMPCQESWVAGNMMLELSGGVGGYELFEEISTGKTTWDDERYVESGKLFQELVEAGAFPESFLGLGYDEGMSMFKNGETAMYQMGTWVTSNLIEGLGEENVGVFLMPAKNPEYQDVHISTLEKVFAVSESCENKEAAIAFIKTLSDPEIQEKYVLECGGIPATNVQISEDKIDSVTLKIMELQKGVKYALTAMDRQFGANVGGEFNNISLAIASGKDSKEQFTALQDYAEQEAEQ